MKKTILTSTALSLLFMSLSAQSTSAISTSVQLEANTNTVQTNVEIKASSSPGVKRMLENNQNRIEARQEIKENRADFKEQLEKQKEEVKERVQNIRETLRDNASERHARRLENRFALYNKQLTNISVRTQTRIDKEKAEGKDTSKAQEALNKAKTTLAKAVEDGKKAVQAFRDIKPEDFSLQQAAVKAAIALTQTARTGFIDSRKLMVEAVVALKTN